MTRQTDARWARAVERLDLGHRAWGYTAFASVTVMTLLLVMRGWGPPHGSLALPVSALIVAPPLVLVGSIGVTRARGTSVQITTAFYVVAIALLMMLPPDRVLLLILSTELITAALRHQPVIKVAFNESSSMMHIAVMGLALHLLNGNRDILTLRGVVVIWLAIIAGDVQQRYHSERFLTSLAVEGDESRKDALWSRWRLERLVLHFVVASSMVVTLRAVAIDRSLWLVTPAMLLVGLVAVLSVTSRLHQSLGQQRERTWLRLVRSPEALGSAEELAAAILSLSRADGIRLVLNGRAAIIGRVDNDLDEVAQSPGTGLRVLRPHGLRKYAQQGAATYRAELPGGLSGDHVLLCSVWRPAGGLETPLEELIPDVVSELALAFARQRDRDELEQAATHDGLTGLLRPAVFTARLDEALTSWTGAAVVLIQVGRLRQINDLFGRGAGDELLRSVAGRLEATLGDTALTCRLGGHLFAAAVACESREAAASVASLLGGVLLRGDAAGSAQAGLTIGVTLAPEDGLVAGDLIRRAELGLDVAWESGQTIAFFEPAVEARANRKLALVTALRGALERGAITAVYQPQVSPHDGRVVGVEALARWTDPELGFVPPDEFIGLAESSGLIQPLTRRILRTALLQCRTWADEGLDVPMSVNLSARSLGDPGTLPLVAGLLEETGVPACALTLEVTETAVMDDPTQAIETLRAIRSLGCKVSLDDFGTGHSSLAYLRTLPADEVKLDRAFTSGLDDPAAMALVRASVELAHALGLTIVAEGVEDQPTLDLLRGVGVDVAQGYHLCRPGTPGAIHDFLHRVSKPAVAA